MELATKTEYAIRALIALVANGNDTPLSIREISTKENLPLKYLEHIFRDLKEYGLIKSVKGVNGGYLMNRAIEEISLWDVMSAIDDQPVKLSCKGKGGYRDYCNGQPCGFYDVWNEIGTEIQAFFATIPFRRFIVCKGDK